MSSDMNLNEIRAASLKFNILRPYASSGENIKFCPDLVEFNHNMQAMSDVAKQNRIFSAVSEIFPQSPEQIKSFEPGDPFEVACSLQ